MEKDNPLSKYLCIWQYMKSSHNPENKRVDLLTDQPKPAKSAFEKRRENKNIDPRTRWDESEK